MSSVDILAVLETRLNKIRKKLSKTIGYPNEPETAHCWLWTGQTTHESVKRYRHLDRYGQWNVNPTLQPARGFITINGDTYQVHRLLMARYFVEDLNTLPLLRNTCGNGLCVNPLHWTLAKGSFPHNTGSPEKRHAFTCFKLLKICTWADVDRVIRANEWQADRLDPFIDEWLKAFN